MRNSDILQVWLANFDAVVGALGTQSQSKDACISHQRSSFEFYPDQLSF